MGEHAEVSAMKAEMAWGGCLASVGDLCFQLRLRLPQALVIANNIVSVVAWK